VASKMDCMALVLNHSKVSKTTAERVSQTILVEQLAASCARRTCVGNWVSCAIATAQKPSAGEGDWSGSLLCQWFQDFNVAPVGVGGELEMMQVGCSIGEGSVCLRCRGKKGGGECCGREFSIQYIHTYCQSPRRRCGV
jgi:hypothetical protein